MEGRRLLCIALCLAELAGCAAGSTTGTATPTATAVPERDTGTAGPASTARGHTSSAAATSAAATAGPVPTSPTAPGLPGQLRTSPQPSPTPTALPGSSPGVPGTPSPPTQPRDSTDTSGSTVVAGSSPEATSEHPGVPAATTAPRAAGDSPERALPAIGCHRARDEGDTGAVCLQLNETNTCEHFLERTGSDLWRAICENRTHSVASPCEIKLTPSSRDRGCLLLILRGEKDPDKLLDTLQKSHWEKFGIESLKRESARSPRERSQKTLIALVTSGLLLALLGLAGYLLMRRRSWSPAGQRLAEDPSSPESRGSSMLMAPPQEPPELQEKPNPPSLNGGTRENGTGQAGSKNGHSGRQHSPADTEM